MQIIEFIKKLEAGQITDFSPFLEKTYSEHFRLHMVKRGIHVHEALAYNEEMPILAAIRANLMKERPRTNLQFLSRTENDSRPIGLGSVLPSCIQYFKHL